MTHASTKILVMFVTVALAVPVAVHAAPSTCPTGDNRCVGMLNRERARTASEVNRGRYLYAAHRAFMFSYNATGEVNDLCESRKAFDEGKKIAKDAFGERFAKSEPLLAERERVGTARCRASAPGAGKPKRSSAPTRPAPQAAPATEADGGLLAIPVRQPDAMANSTASAGLLNVGPAVTIAPPTTAAPAVQAVAATSEPASTDSIASPSGPNTDAPTSKLRLRRVTAGAALLLTSGAFAAGFGVSLSARGEINRSIEALDAQILAEQRNPSEEEKTSERALNADYRRLTTVAGVTGAAAVLALGTSAALFALIPRRTRVAALPWGTPRAVGLSIQGRF